MLSQTIPSYLYYEYSDDPDLQAFVTTYNAMAQEYVTWFYQVGVPVYTGPLISDALLDWVALGLYGLQRPTLDRSPVTDDVFKRIISWHFFKGGGKVFDVRWLKRRIMRFLAGINGTDPGIDQTYQVSVRFVGDHVVDINVYAGVSYNGPGAVFNTGAYNAFAYNGLGAVIRQYVDTTLAPILKQAIDAGVLELPFQYTYVVSVDP